MSLTHMNGDIFTTMQPVIGHGVNMVGLMGGGLAAQVKNKYPSVDETYRLACETEMFKEGQTLMLLVDESEHEGTRYIANIGSQILPGAHADIELLRTGFRDALMQTDELGLTGMAVPEIGAGIGGLVWEDVLTVMEDETRAYPGLEIEVWHYTP